jgi:hypothetical protein
MQTATTKQVRKMARTIVGNMINSCKGWGSYTWTDRAAGGADMRSVAFRIGYGMRDEERQAVAKRVSDMFLLAGYDNAVTVTDSTDSTRMIFNRDNGGTYLRIKARLG